MSLIGSILTEPGAALFPEGVIYLSFSLPSRFLISPFWNVLSAFTLSSPLTCPSSLHLGLAFLSMPFSHLKLTRRRSWSAGLNLPL